jgi:integrase
MALRCRRVGAVHSIIHDLRRTARTLMSDVGVSSEIAERIMGHAIAGVEGTYNRSKHLMQKADGLQHLANKIEQIINPAPVNVVPLKPRR